LTEEQADNLASRGDASIDKSRELSVTFTPPICEVCEQSWEERTYSCRGSREGT
jgi:hypothetical protein